MCRYGRCKLKAYRFAAGIESVLRRKKCFMLLVTPQMTFNVEGFTFQSDASPLVHGKVVLSLFATGKATLTKLLIVVIFIGDLK